MATVRFKRSHRRWQVGQVYDLWPGVAGTLVSMGICGWVADEEAGAVQTMSESAPQTMVSERQAPRRRRRKVSED